MIKQGAINCCLQDIRQLGISLKKIGKRVTPDILGFYGELIVWGKLEHIFAVKGYHIATGAGQTQADLFLEKDDKRIKIEVKSSRLKDEWYGIGYGYAINVKKCKLHSETFVNHPKKGKVFGDFCYFDYLIAVQISDNLQKCELYVFPRRFFEQHEKELRNKNKRFSSATHRMIFIQKASGTKDITSFDRRLNIEKRKYKNAWGLIKKD